MKKVIAILGVLVLTLGMSLTALAAPSPTPGIDSNPAISGATGEGINSDQIWITTGVNGSNDFSAWHPNWSLPDGYGTNGNTFHIVDIHVDNHEGEITLTLTTQFPQGTQLRIHLFNPQTGQWSVLTDVTVGAGGAITLTFPHLTPVAFEVLRASSNASQDTSGSSGGTTGTSPKTGETSFVNLAYLMAAFAVVGMVVASKKKKV